METISNSNLSEIKASELRIGNYYLNPNNEVRQITYHEIRLLVVAIESPNYSLIPLTEEWLAKFGFDNFMGKGKVYMKPFFNIEIWENNTFQYETQSGFCREIKHVHQLQNLYFALTGKELKYEKQ